jgi:uncharacterized membrane protein YeaQ/YmgE (transglycosylase-associated protein family)
MLIDTSVVRIYEVIDKDFAPSRIKISIFSAMAFLCLLLQFATLKQVWKTFKTYQLQSKLQAAILLISLGILGSLLAVMIFQMYFYDQYNSFTTIAIIAMSYGTATVFIVWLSWMFLTWYRSSRKFIVLLYAISMWFIAFNLIMTAVFSSAKVSDRPNQIGAYVGGGGDMSGGRHAAIDFIYRVSSFTSFFALWFTTATLMASYRERLLSGMKYWIVLLIPLVYFIVTFFYQFILGNLLSSYVYVDPVTVTIILLAFLSLSKPIGGLVFGAAFWNMARTVSYEKRIKTYMFISGWGIFLIFAGNQATAQLTTPFPPFGVPTITVLTVAAYLVLIGIYNSAKLVSVNNNLRKDIYQHALRPELLHSIGRAEMEREVQKTVNELITRQDILGREREIQRVAKVELDQKELRKYLDQVIEEIKRNRSK